MTEQRIADVPPVALELHRAIARWDVASGDAIGERGRLVIDVAGKTIGIFRLDGALVAYENRCPHQGGPVCQGLIVAAVREVLDEQRVSHGMGFDESDPHIVCPWHGYEFRIATGRHAGVERIGLKTIPVEEDEGRVYVVL